MGSSFNVLRQRWPFHLKSIWTEFPRLRLGQILTVRKQGSSGILRNLFSRGKSNFSDQRDLGNCFRTVDKNRKSLTKA